jgi:hypothetical protein
VAKAGERGRTVLVFGGSAKAAMMVVTMAPMMRMIAVQMVTMRRRRGFSGRRGLHWIGPQGE